MKSMNPSSENCRSGVMGLGSNPGHAPAVVSVRVSHGHRQYEVSVPSNSDFGYLKSIISQRLGLKPETCKLFFGGIDKQDNESLQTAGVENNSEVLLVEDMGCGQQIPVEVRETPAASKGEDAVAEVRKEVDKLEQQVSALQADINSGKKFDEKQIIYLTEMLVRQLLKLDGIEAEGEGKVQRKTEVRRVQILVETLDTLKSRNSNSSGNTSEAVSVATDWEPFELLPSSTPPAGLSSPSPTPSPSSAPPTFPSSSVAPTPAPSSTQSVMPPSSPSLMPSSTYPVPYPTPSSIPQPTYSAVPHFMPSTHPSSVFPGMAYPAASPMPHFAPSTHHPYQYYDPSQMAYPPPYNVASSPAPPSAPYHDGSSYIHHPTNPFSMPPTTVTQNWEHFG